MSFFSVGGRLARPVLRAGLASALAAATLLPGLPRVPLAAAQTLPPQSTRISVNDVTVVEGRDVVFTVSVTNNPGIYVD